MAGDRLTPEQSYRFARGEEVVSSTGVPAKLSRPLDFLVVSDHAEGLGIMSQVLEGNPAFMSDATLVRWSKAMKAGGKDRADQVLPFSAWQSEDPEKLWEWMEKYEKTTGGKLLAIPHNANLSDGRMLELVDFAGKPLSKDYAERRARWEHVSEQGFGKTRYTWHYTAAGYAGVWGNADRRKIGLKGKLTPASDTVDVSRATWADTIGDPQLSAVWKDPDFDPSIRAFYYVRAIEIPTLRWTCYDAVRFGIKMPPEVPMKHQERAWTSPTSGSAPRSSSALSSRCTWSSPWRPWRSSGRFRCRRP